MEGGTAVVMQRDPYTPIPARNAEIVARIQAGEKRYMLAEEYGLTKPSITMIGRKAGIPPYTRPGRSSN